MSSQLRRAGQWLAHSGIQLPNGGVARYYRADLQRNLSVSTEITGYAISSFVFLHQRTGDAEYLDCARAAAHFLTAQAWDGTGGAMPFEVEPAAYSYFFDCGIIVRGLLALWRVTAEPELLEVAVAIGESMARDFADNEGGYWPIISLPGKQPLPVDPQRWSRSPGCYQLKAALAWRELAEATGETEFLHRYERTLEHALTTHEGFLPGHSAPEGVMDRLHAYLYFLEALLPRAEEPRCAAALADGVCRVGQYVDEIGPHFARCDVLAQLMRVRLCVWKPDSSGSAVHPAEAERVSSFQAAGGGFYFGRRSTSASPGGWIPHLSPVPTAFALQALEWWERPETIDRRAII